MIERITLADLCQCASPLCLSPRDTVAAAIAAMQQRRVSSVILVEGDAPVGLFTERDALGLIARDGQRLQIPLQPWVTKDLATASPDLGFAEAYALMTQMGHRHLILVDAQGALSGIVSETDFAAALGADELLTPRTVATLMTPDPVALPPQATLREALSVMETHAISAVIVTDAGRPLGILTERDTLRLAGVDLDATSLGSHMSRPVHTISPDEPAHEVVPRFRALGIRRLVVVDGSGRLIGILTRRDLLKNIHDVYLRLLKRILAEQGRALRDARRQINEQAILRGLLSQPGQLGILVADADQRIRLINEAALGALGMARADVSALNLSELLRAGGLKSEGLVERLAALRNEERLTLDLEQTRGDARSWLRLVGSLIQADGGAAQDKHRTPDVSGEGVLNEEVLGEEVPSEEVLAEEVLTEEVLTEESLDRGVPAGAALEKDGHGADVSAHHDLGYLLILQDQTREREDAERLKRMLAELSDARERLLEAQAVAHLGSWDCDHQADRFECSGEWYRIVGRPLGTEVKLATLLAIIHPEDLEGFEAFFRRPDPTPHPHETLHRIVRQTDGEVRWVKTRFVQTSDASGEIIHTHGTLQDVTEEQASHQRQRLINQLFESTSEGIMVTDADNRIIAVNPAFTRISGYRTEEALGQNPRLLSSGRHRPAFFRHVWQSLHDSGSWSGEIWNRRKNGEIFLAWLQINVVRGLDGEISQHVALFSDQTQAQRSAEEIEYLSHHDPLTGLLNLSRLRMRLNEAMEQAATARHRLVLLILDLDRFSDLVASLGHLASDEVLKEIGMRLATSSSPADIPARMANDSFVVIRPIDAQQDAAVQAMQAAQFLLGLIQRPMDLADFSGLTVTASVGVAIYPEDGANGTILLRNAESALNQAKRAGRRAIAFYRPELTQAARRRVQLERELRHALQEGELRLVFQPIVDTRERVVVAAEALLRWQHPSDGLIGPSDFIEAVEHSDLVAPIGRWVLDHAVRQALSWQAAGRVRVSINVSGPQLTGGALAREIGWILDNTGLDPERLGIEVLERVLLSDPDEALAELKRVRDLGVAIALDDFGSGFSSLSYLKRLPVDSLKIDRGFIRHLVTDPTDAAIVRSTIAMAHSLGLKVIAEGVEKIEQLEYLSDAGCDLVQGYLLGRPMDGEALQQAMAGSASPPPSD